jgi:putative ABC transport system permease protein
MPVALDRSDATLAHTYVVLYGHLKPGLDPKAAAADVTVLARRFAQVYRQDYPKQFDVHLESLGHIAAGKIRSTLFTLVGAVSLLLLIACANVANLLLAKATSRERELAVRMALGAGRFRIIRQLIVESLLLALAGAALGCAFAWAGLQGLLALLPIYTFPDEADVSLNPEVLLVTVAISMLAALIFGLAPAWLAARRDLNDPLKAGSRGNSGFGQGRLRKMLIVSEVALALLLLTGSGLLMRSFFMQRRIDLGMRTDHLLITGLTLPAKQYRTADSQARFLRDLLPRLERLPGVISAAGALDYPPRGGMDTDFDVPRITHSERWHGRMSPCSSQFFGTLRLRPLAGRLLTPYDENGKRRVAVINQTLAAKYFGRQDPIGRPLQISALTTAADPSSASLEIVGVVSDMKNDGALHAVLPEAFVPYTVSASGGYIIFFRTAGNPAALATALEGAVLAIDRTVIPQETDTMDHLLEVSQYARPRFGLILLSVFAGIGLVLVTVGVYSVISYSVAQQRHEIGIRMVLGATARHVRLLVLATVLRSIFLGVGVGVLLAFLAGRGLASQIWGVSWYDPATLGAGIVILTVAGLAAAYLPAVRATRVDPAISLRCD